MLAHDYEHVPADALTLEEGLAHLAGARVRAASSSTSTSSCPGYEERVVEALRAHGLLERALVSTLYMRSLVALRELEPRLRLGWSVPRVRRDYTASPLTLLPAFGVLLRHAPAAARGSPPATSRAGRCDALMAHWRLVTPRLVRALREAGGDLYVWTVDDARAIRRARGARRDRRDHERPAAVRRRLRRSRTMRGAEVGRVGAGRAGVPGLVTRAVAAHDRAAARATGTCTTPRSTCAPPAAGGLNLKVQPDVVLAAPA